LLEVVRHDNLADELEYVHVLVQLRCLDEPELKAIFVRVERSHIFFLFVTFLRRLGILNYLLRDHSQPLDEAFDIL